MKKWLSLALLLMVVAFLLWWRQFSPAPPVLVASIAQVTSRGLVGSAETNAGELFLEEHPHSRIQILEVYEYCKPEETKLLIQQAMAQGVRFFITTHPSKCAVPSMGLFADARALTINTASTSPALTGKDDFLLRIIPDTVQEQRAIARYVNRMPGHRILVLQDTGNPPYTDPAFATFAAELDALGQWRIVHHKLLVAEFRPDDYREIMAQPFDALYILAGTFQIAIANIAQLFHYLHPETPILLTPWARSPEILETAGDAIDQLILPSQYVSRHQDPALEALFGKFRARFGYEAHVQIVGVSQALELLDDAFAKGYDTPERVKEYLLSGATHQTSLGPITFDRYGDVHGDFHFLQQLRQELQ